MFRRLFFGALLLLPGSLSAQPQAQVEPISRPRRTQTAPTDSNHSHTKPVNADAEAKRLYKAGTRYGHAGLYLQAAEAFEQAIKLKPDYGEAYLSLGHAYYDLSQWQLSVKNLEKGLALKPGDKDSRRRLAHAQSMLQQERLSRKDAEDAASSVGSSKSSPATDSPATDSKTAAQPRADDENLTKLYRVGPGDVLDVRLTDAASSQSTLFTVTAAGLLEHPSLSAPLACAGLTVDEIASRIGQDLKERSSIKNPKVSVAVQEYISHTILVSGLVKEPGTKSFKREGIPLYVVVADAQTLPEAGRVSVLRNTSNETFMIDLLDTPALNMLVRPGDVINVLARQNQFFYMSGQVKSPGEKTFHRGLTLTQAIIAAGGLSKDAKEAQVARDNGKGFLMVTRYKLREIDSGKVRDPAIQPGDRITIMD